MNEPCVIVDMGASVPKVNPPEKEKKVTQFELQLLTIVMGVIILAMAFITTGYHLAYYFSCKV